MISVFRHHLQGRFLRYVVYAVSFFILFPSAIMVFFRWFEGGTDWVIKVNRQTVELGAYQQRVYGIEQQINRFKQMFGDQAEAFFAMQGLSDNPHKIALDSLVDQSLLEQVAKKLHITLSSTYFNQELIKMVPRDVVSPDGKIDMQRLAHAYNTSVAQLQDEFYNQAVSNLLIQMTEGAIYLPTFLLKEKFIESYSNRSFLIAEFPLQKLIKQEEKTVVSDEKLQTFFSTENKKTKRYWVPEMREGLVWKFSPSRYSMKISDKQLQNYYNQNKYKEFIDEPVKIQVRQIVLKFTDKNKSQVRSKLAAIKQEIDKNPELFIEKAKEFSEDNAGKKKKDGLTDFFARGEHVEAFDQAAFRLQKDGDISEIIEMPDHFALIQRVAKKAQTFKQFEQVKNKIEGKLQATQFSRLFQHDVKRALAQEDKLKALEELAHKKGGKKEQITLREKGTEPYMQKFFTVRKNGGGSILMGDDGYAFFVTEVQKSYQPKFESFKKEIRDDWYRSKAVDALAKLLKEGEKLADKDAFEQFVNKHGGSLETTGKINQQMHENVKGLSQRLGGSIGKLFAMTLPGKVAAFQSSDAGFLVCLETINPFDEKKFEEQKRSIEQELYQEQKRLVEQAFIASLSKNATIKVNEKILK